jgi:signal transduction histidine kinase
LNKALKENKRILLIVISVSMVIGGHFFVMNTVQSQTAEKLNDLFDSDEFTQEKMNVILAEEKFFTQMFILYLASIAAILIFVFEKYKLREQKHKDRKLITVGEMASRLAHDLRNPLSIIKMALENLKLEYGADEKKQEGFDRVERSIGRMTHQIDTVLDFVKEQPKIMSKAKISEIISESKDSIIIPETIKLILPENEIEVFCDKKQLAIAINNLIHNAIQAINDQGSIEISCEENYEQIVIKVKDSGKGILRKDISHIFEPLFTTKLTGTGLGLPSVKSIVESHRGTISVTSPPTVFTITLPKNLE